MHFIKCDYFASEEQEDEEANTGSHLKLIVDAFIQQLPNCVNRDLIDKVKRTMIIILFSQQNMSEFMFALCWEYLI